MAMLYMTVPFLWADANGGPGAASLVWRRQPIGWDDRREGSRRLEPANRRYLTPARLSAPRADIGHVGVDQTSCYYSGKAPIIRKNAGGWAYDRYGKYGLAFDCNFARFVHDIAGACALLW